MAASRSLKSSIKLLVPPIVASLAKRAERRGLFVGNYSTWSDARDASSGYDSAPILEHVTAAMLKVLKGEAAYERDSVTFDRVSYEYPLLAALLRVAAMAKGRLSVLDFGGSLGSSFVQCRPFLAGIDDLRWSVVEQKAFVERGRARFETGQLRFYVSIEECLEREAPNAILLSGVLEYLENPYALLEQIDETRIDHLIVDRVPFTDAPADRIAVQKVPPAIYPASYPVWLFGAEALSKALARNWRIIAEFNALDGRIQSRFGVIAHRGFVLERRRVERRG